MPTKRYKLLQNHPYAKKGTIVEEYERKNSLGRVKVMIPDVQIINIPLGVEHDWLEEMKEEPLKAISLFASGGIGDLALRANGIDVLLANELLEDRASLLARNFPEAQVIGGDIWEKRDEIVEITKSRLGSASLDLVLATPPCQGMSKNGQGKLLQGIRDGKKPKYDIRNQLVIPTLDIICQLKPVTVVFENVPEMENTFIEDESGTPIKIVEYISRRLGKEYVGRAEVVQFADYGVPQRRARLITVFSRHPLLKDHFAKYRTLLPLRTHAKNGENGLQKWVSVREIIANLPPLDSQDKKSATSSIPFHRVPVLDEKKYYWIKHTPPERGAFDNQCINPKCRFQGNPTHGSERDTAGINKAKKDTPLNCLKCGSLLPRPYTEDKTGEKRIMFGYTSSYKRMSWDLPAPTLTTNMSYPCSDHKVHPEQNRVLSLYEAFKLHTLDSFDFVWEHRDGKPAKDTTIREVMGESIPPMGLFLIFKHLCAVSSG